ncbi:MAG TPA: alpha/beta fold hydrolase [Planctomycetota bacterium]|nr:alpha/beta fold hydrolase [Planctomycetota bacterium]
MKPFRILLVAAAALVTTSHIANAQEEDMKLREIRYLSSADDTKQPARFWAPETGKPVPLLVVLHTWSGGYRQDYHTGCVDHAMKKGWAVILPDFRGPNSRPEACGSELAVKDILSAVKYAKEVATIDESRIYLVGASGGGHAALLMAGRAPKTWAGVSAWVGISDLKAWHAECTARKLGYAGQIERCCGGPPGTSAGVDEEYRRRSPLTWLRNAKDVVPLDINAGITDGHTGSVPISQSLRAFNAVAEVKDRISDADIQYMTEKAEIPPNLKEKIADASYGGNVPLYRRTSVKARVTIFRGGHQIVHKAAMTWLEKQKKD